MKKSFKLLLSVLTLALCIGSLSGCKEKLKETKGKVVSVETNKIMDQFPSMKVLADGDTLIFNTKNAEYTNGIMIPGDSVTVYYHKTKTDTLHASVVNVMAKPSKEVDLDTLKDKPLLTR